jgi:hypothetical protein
MQPIEPKRPNFAGICTKQFRRSPEVIGSGEFVVLVSTHELSHSLITQIIKWHYGNFESSVFGISKMQLVDQCCEHRSEIVSDFSIDEPGKHFKRRPASTKTRPAQVFLR